MSLAQRAATAFTHAGGYSSIGIDDPVRRALKGRLIRDLAGLLGVDPVAVTAADDPDRRYGPGPEIVLTVTDDDGLGYRFAPDPATAGGFFLLERCPECGAHVPVTVITQLAELGGYLDDPTPDAVEVLGDPGHRTGCVFAREVI